MNGNYTTFGKTERDYREMLDRGGIFVGDRWFDQNSSAAERAEYLAKYEHRIERNRRRRERRHAVVTERKERAPRRKIPNDPESQRAHRMPLERRKCIRRSTLASCPTPNEIRTAWHFHNDSREAFIRLGGLLLDLECYVDNSLITIIQHHHLKIVGRHGGLKEWIRENCPELEANYKTLQNIKGIVKRLRQRAGVIDPIPVSALMNTSIDFTGISESDVKIQPRGGRPDQVRDRFVWEKSPILIDADGHTYFHNENYWLVNYLTFRHDIENLEIARKDFRTAISPDGKENCTIGTYSKSWGSGSVDGVGSCGKGDVGDCAGYGDGWCGEGFVEGWVNMFKDLATNPEMRRAIHRDMLRDIKEGLKDVATDIVLPRRTKARMKRGERTSLGRFILDAMDGYLDFYSQFLIYRWGRGYCEDW